MSPLSNTVDAVYDAASGDATWASVDAVLRTAIGADRIYLTMPAADGTFPNLFQEGSPY